MTILATQLQFDLFDFDTVNSRDLELKLLTKL